MLRGIKPTAVEKRLKALFYGVSGAGKTMCALQFPAPYLIDTERGCENNAYVKLLESNGGALFQTAIFDEMIQEIKTLLTVEHPYKTLIIDPLTTLYNDLLDKAALKLGTDFGKHYSEANKQMKHLLSLLVRLDMNVIITSHSKNEYGKDMIVLGQTFDCYKKLDYLFDLVIEVQKRGQSRMGVVKKSRLESLKDGEQFEFSYKEIAKRYGSEVLEKKSESECLTTEEQLSELIRLIELLNIDNETITKWLTKANAASFEEMNQEHAQKCIDYLQSKIKGDK